MDITKPLINVQIGTDILKVFYSNTIALEDGNVKRNGYRSDQYLITLGFGSFGYRYNVTDNCQLGCFSSFTSLCSRGIKKELKRQALFTIFASDNIPSKPMALIDVTEKVSTDVDEMFTEDEIITKTPYISTRNSSMVLYLVNVNRFLINERTIK